MLFCSLPTETFNDPTNILSFTLWTWPHVPSLFSLNSLASHYNHPFAHIPISHFIMPWLNLPLPTRTYVDVDGENRSQWLTSLWMGDDNPQAPWCWRCFANPFTLPRCKVPSLQLFLCSNLQSILPHSHSQLMTLLPSSLEKLNQLEENFNCPLNTTWTCQYLHPYTLASCQGIICVSPNALCTRPQIPSPMQGNCFSNLPPLS